MWIWQLIRAPFKLLGLLFKGIGLVFTGCKIAAPHIDTGLNQLHKATDALKVAAEKWHEEHTRNLAQERASALKVQKFLNEMKAVPVVIPGEVERDALVKQRQDWARKRLAEMEKGDS